MEKINPEKINIGARKIFEKCSNPNITEDTTIPM